MGQKIGYANERVKYKQVHGGALLIKTLQRKLFCEAGKKQIYLVSPTFSRFSKVVYSASSVGMSSNISVYQLENTE